MDEDAIFEQQSAWIKEQFGEEAALLTNYGWFVWEDSFVISKVYGYGILTTYPDLSFDWEEYA